MTPFIVSFNVIIKYSSRQFSTAKCLLNRLNSGRNVEKKLQKRLVSFQIGNRYFARMQNQNAQNLHFSLAK